MNDRCVYATRNEPILGKKKKTKTQLSRLITCKLHVFLMRTEPNQQLTGVCCIYLKGWLSGVAKMEQINVLKLIKHKNLKSATVF